MMHPFIPSEKMQCLVVFTYVWLSGIGSHRRGCSRSKNTACSFFHAVSWQVCCHTDRSGAMPHSILRSTGWAVWSNTSSFSHPVFLSGSTVSPGKWEWTLKRPRLMDSEVAFEHITHICSVNSYNFYSHVYLNRSARWILTIRLHNNWTALYYNIDNKPVGWF